MSDKAFAAALRMLGRRDHFSAELTAKLVGRGFSNAEAEHAVERCRAERFVDDRRTAARFVEVRASERGWGPRRLRAELTKRGLDGGLAHEAVRDAEDVETVAMATALRRVEARRPKGWWRLPEVRSRMVGSLISRGFDAEVARTAVSELAAQRETDHHEEHDHPGDPVDLS